MRHEAQVKQGYVARKAVSFFSGGMGLDIGLMQAGVDVAVAQEFDAASIKTIAANGHSVVPGDIVKLLEDDPNLDSLRQVAGLGQEPPFLVAGGPPCQPFSTAGHRRGVKDKRGLLIFDYLRAIRVLRPRFALLENVKGLLSSAGISHPNLIDDVVDDFESMGYHVEWGLVDAVDYGAAQFRERVVIVASRDGEPIFVPEPTHFRMHQDASYRWRSFSDATADLDESLAEHTRFSAKVQTVLDQVPDGGNWRSLPPAVAQAAMGGAWASGGGKVGFFRRLASDQPSPTLTTSPVQKATMLSHPTKPRPLSVQEYARIQGFPDDWVFQGTIANKYKQIGNAVPVPLGRAFGQMFMSVADGSHIVPTKRYRSSSKGKGGKR